MTRLDLATEEDEKSGLVKWVKLFKAKTWEEMKMIAENDIDMLEATDNLYLSNADQTARDIAWHRQERIYLEKREKAEKERLTKALAEKDTAIADLELEIVRLKAELAAEKNKK